MPGLTISREHYLKTIYDLSEKEPGVRVTDIADTLHVSKASVCNAVKALQKIGLAFRDESHLVFLTEKGKGSASAISENYQILIDFFIKNLNMNEALAIKQACALEHVMSSEDLLSMEKLLPKEE